MAKPTIDIELSPADLGLPRFVEAHLAIVVRAKPEPHDCQRAVQELLATYPMLAMRMDFWVCHCFPGSVIFSLANGPDLMDLGLQQRTKLLPSDYPPEIYHSRVLKKDLDEVLPCQTAKVGPPAVQLLDTCSLTDCLNFNRDIWDEICGEPVLRIRVVFFNDAWAVRFIMSHTLGDIRAMYWIADCFFAFLSGREVQTVSPIRSILAFKSDTIDSWNALTASGTTHSVAEDHQHEIVAGWLPTILSGARQILWSAYEASSPRRQVNKSLFIPQCIIDYWVQGARREGIQVTEHDLLMGFIYEATYQALSAPPHFTFLMNFHQQLQSPGPLGNTWFQIPIPALHKSKSSPSTPFPKDHSSTLLPMLLHHAQLIRDTIIKCRHPACFPEIHEQHRRLGTTPWRPRSFGTRSPHVMVSCWTKQQWYELDCTGGTPLFVDLGACFYRLFQLLGVQGPDDFVGTIKCPGGRNSTLMGDHEGYWVQGRLPEVTWATMVDMLTVVSFGDGGGQKQGLGQTFANI
ncbi:hypothetical protein CBS147321_10189 [Aspergillus niger]|nr:hypothetical protein CBS133816_3875 [Aspergillus niger]KAI2866460.1 hypothetical protein CBS12448_1184 [Aspergillus niger]KAI2929181.1 hypothetical protein CBS147320_4059 [Aspergillus niger]KAI2931665.1 hypothetical protein CBS147321_10189 [Aspergillus niger]KAI2938607.1 hypothetical protein CBS147322_10543 [Aspergillus niger]